VSSEHTVIRSRSNPLVARASAALAGREEALLVLQGDRLIEDALGAGRPLQVILVADDRLPRAEELEARGQNVKLVSAELLARVSSLKSSPGILALCDAPPALDLDALQLDRRALVLVAAGVADPGNLGALARAAEAFGVRALVVIAGSASPWNEKALRGSMGSLLRCVRQVLAATRGGGDPARFDWTGPVALWISGETGRLAGRASSFETLTIPIQDGVESLNVTVAASILLYAARSARG
jgi:TrmH family RNA methyltransferase